MAEGGIAATMALSVFVLVLAESVVGVHLLNDQALD